MNKIKKTYTYRGGKKIKLGKSLGKIAVRALPDGLDDTSIVVSEQVSSNSIRIKISDVALKSLMERGRSIGPTHYAYYEAICGREVLITDRIFVIIKETPSNNQMDEFAGRYAFVNKTIYGDLDYLYQVTNRVGMNPCKLTDGTEINPNIVEGN